MISTNKNHDALIKRIDDYMQGASEELGTVILADCRAALSQSEPVRYVPMADDDFMQIDISTGMNDPKEAWAYERNIEYAAIRRAIAQGAKLEVQE